MTDAPSPQPFHFAAVASMPGGVGAELGMQPAVGWTVAAQATWFLALGDATVVVRRHLNGGSGPYLAAGPYGLWTPILFPERFPIAPGVLFALGWEWSATSGQFLAAELGCAGIYAPPGSEGGGNEFGAIPRVQVRLGGRW